MKKIYVKYFIWRKLKAQCKLRMKDVNNCKMLIFIIKIENLFYTEMFKTYIIYFLLSIIDLLKLIYQNSIL